ncbi:hypothetical protein GM3708_3083 [Geminocystis sp. NIES-3708]|uniref:sulfotransferase family protein n=1 Tax=Geminocystis sp. NIES-3708 TaxID=1615909 RepID=UPI0005FCBC43|nr:sulfotransferase family protein [Geminocystis sp. NIES-3708]BAQ62677.1 hypothetical protein GM3708_3083 [Geminocystis sp. NIES-3708]
MHDNNPQIKNNVGFAIGTGRCGTNFLAKLLELEPQVKSTHERNALNETFHRYCKWYNLPVDHEGFLNTKQNEIFEDLKKNSYSFEASAFLSVSVKELYERFGAKFILLVRSPEKVINSYLVKGWYEDQFLQKNHNLALGYQKNKSFHHFLGRPAPIGEKFMQWQTMTRVGKLAWYWNELNSRVINLFEQIPQEYWKIQTLEEFNYQSYIEIANFFGFQPEVTLKQFENLTNKKPNGFTEVPTIVNWTDQEKIEFEQEVQSMAKYFGYQYQINLLPIPKTYPITFKQKFVKTLKKIKRILLST